MESVIEFIAAFATVTLWLISIIATMGIAITIGGSISYAKKRGCERKIENWQNLDQVDGLRFVPSPMLLGNERPIWYKIFYFACAERSYVQGAYNDVQTHLTVIDKNQNKRTVHYTRLTALPPKTLDSEAVAQFEQQTVPLPRPQVESILFPRRWQANMDGKLKIESQGKIVWERRDIETHFETLQIMIDRLSTTAKGYSLLCVVGGLAVSGLANIVKHGQPGKLIAKQLVQDIGRQTQQYQAKMDRLYCPICFTRYGKHSHSLGWFQFVTHYGCRTCGHSRGALELLPVAILDQTMPKDTLRRNGQIMVNWLTYLQPFDFTRIEIHNASDEDVERLAMQMGNDTDPVRQAGYKAVTVFISLTCQLSPNTKQVLAKQFGGVQTLSPNLRIR